MNVQYILAVMALSSTVVLTSNAALANLCSKFDADDIRFATELTPSNATKGRFRSLLPDGIVVPYPKTLGKLRRFLEEGGKQDELAFLESCKYLAEMILTSSYICSLDAGSKSRKLEFVRQQFNNMSRQAADFGFSDQALRIVDILESETIRLLPGRYDLRWPESSTVLGVSNSD